MKTITFYLKKVLPYFLTFPLIFSCSVEDENLDDSEAFSSTNISEISSATPLAGKTYYIKSVHSGKYIDVSGRSENNGAQIHQWSYTGGTNQQWKIVSNGSTYRIISINSNVQCMICARRSSVNFKLAQGNTLV